MKQLSNRRAFAAAYVRLVEKTGDANVSVVDLTHEVGCSRKTFYRYFEDVEDLSVWHFRDALMIIATELFPDAIHVRPSPCLKDKYGGMPFYVRIVDEAGEINQAAWTAAVAAHFEEHARYYAIVFRQDRRFRDFRVYFRDLLAPALKDDIRYMLNGRMIPETFVNFLAEYHAAGIVGRLDQFVCERGSAMSDEDDLHFNYAHASIARDIDEYFVLRGKGR